MALKDIMSLTVDCVLQLGFKMLHCTYNSLQVNDLCEAILVLKKIK